MFQQRSVFDLDNKGLMQLNPKLVFIAQLADTQGFITDKVSSKSTVSAWRILTPKTQKFMLLVTKAPPICLALTTSHADLVLVTLRTYWGIIYVHITLGCHQRSLEIPQTLVPKTENECIQQRPLWAALMTAHANFHFLGIYWPSGLACVKMSLGSHQRSGDFCR